MTYMQHAILKGRSFAIIHDASVMPAPGVDDFTADSWKARNALVGEAVGRGSAWFIDAPFGAVVLRNYFRGGWVAKVSRDRYFFTGIESSRPFREFRILSELYELGLPVPRPVAALCEHHGVLSTGALITARIPAVQTLADLLPLNHADSDMNTGVWGLIGQCIRRFHDAGVWHADLNARNILLDDHLNVFLIDFDRARFIKGGVVNGEGNLNRLNRSLRKLWPSTDIDTLQAAWILLEAGYHD